MKLRKYLSKQKLYIIPRILQMLNMKFVFLLALASVLVNSEQISLHEQDCQSQFQDILYSFHPFLQFCIHQRNLAEIIVNVCETDNTV